METKTTSRRICNDAGDHLPSSTSYSQTTAPPSLFAAEEAVSNSTSRFISRRCLVGSQQQQLIIRNQNQSLNYSSLVAHDDDACSQPWYC
mmetsp:Transcript_12346/g.16868  ORF Transcript_12346/g.16868 Transcript_12346/m.16868 type:complete len:90 (-) Transcript_12346:227-496(-)